MPQPLMRRRIPSGRGSMEQPNVTSDGEAALTPKFWLAVVATGVATGLLGAALMLLLFNVQYLAFGYHSGSLDAALARDSGLRRVVPLLIGGAFGGVAWYLLRRWTPGERSEIDDAIWNGDGILSARRSAATSVISEIVIGLGASIGREAAPKLMGGVSASVLSGWMGLTVPQRRLLVACGGGAGLAAVYNVPLGGAVFATEVLLHSAAPRVVVPALVTSAVATAVAWTVLPNRATYSLPHYPLTLSLLVWSVLAGPVFATAGALFVRLTDLAAAHAAKGWLLAILPLPVFTALGALAIVYPQLLGNGKGPAQVAFAGGLGLGTLAVLAALKPMATAAMLVTGATGGRLTPALATGALLGALLGGGWTHLWHGTDVGAFALAGAAAVLAVTLRAPICAIVLTWEFTHAPLPLLVPMTLAVATAIATGSAAARGLAARRRDAPREPRREHPSVLQ